MGLEAQEKSPHEEQLTARPLLQGYLAVMDQEAKIGPRYTENNQRVEQPRVLN